MSDQHRPRDEHDDPIAWCDCRPGDTPGAHDGPCRLLAHGHATTPGDRDRGRELAELETALVELGVRLAPGVSDSPAEDVAQVLHRARYDRVVAAPAETGAGSRCANCDHTDDDHGARGSGVPGPRACRRDGPDCDCWGYIAPDPRASPPAQGPAETEAGDLAPDDYRRYSTSQVRGALGWLLAHHYGDQGANTDDMPGMYENAADVIGRDNAQALGALLAATPPAPEGEAASKVVDATEARGLPRGSQVVQVRAYTDRPVPGTRVVEIGHNHHAITLGCFYRVLHRAPAPAGPAQAAGGGETCPTCQSSTHRLCER